MPPGIPRIAAAPPPRPALPLAFPVVLTVEDWCEASMRAHPGLLARSRRAILTVLLPLFWFLVLLGLASHWFTSGDSVSLGSILQDLAEELAGPVGVILLVGSVVIVLVWASQPRMVRAGHRRMLRDSGFTQPIALTCVLDEAGVAIREDDREAFVPWATITEITQSRDRFFLSVTAMQEPIVLPKAAVPAAQRALVEAWLPGKAGDAGNGAPPPPVRSDDALRFSFALDATDRAEAIRWYLDQPAMRRRQLRGYALGWAGFSLLAPLLAVFAWVIDPSRVPLEYAGPLFVEMFGSFFWQPAAAMALISLGLVLARGPLLRRTARNAGRFLQEHADPTPLDVALDEAGLLAVQGASFGRFAWSAFRRVERTAQHWFLPISRGSAVLIPRRALDAEQVSRLEALLARHIAPP